MRYRFQVEKVEAAKGTLPRDERSDLLRYFSETAVEAEDGPGIPPAPRIPA